MGKDTATAAARNKRIRQEALREQLAAQGHVQHAVDLISKLSNESQEIDANMVNRMRIALDGHFKLIDKYLGNIKSVELTGEDGGPVTLGIQVSFK